MPDAEKASQEAHDIAIENRARLMEGDAGNRAGGVAADAGKREDVIEVLGKPAVVLRDDLLRGSLKIADPLVIAESFPELVQFGFGRAGESLDRRECLHPASPVRQDGFDLRLLEHDLGNPDGVGVTRAAPGEIAGVGGKPVQQKRDELPRL